MRLRRELLQYLRAHGDSNDDYGAAELIVGELISNAARYTPGPLCVEIGWEDHHARLNLHDAGRGVKWLPRLPENAADEGGRGMYIVSRLALDVEVHSDSQGSRISVMLPIAQPPVPPMHGVCPLLRTPTTPGICVRPRNTVSNR